MDKIVDFSIFCGSEMYFNLTNIVTKFNFKVESLKAELSCD